MVTSAIAFHCAKLDETRGSKGKNYDGVHGFGWIVAGFLVRDKLGDIARCWQSIYNARRAPAFRITAAYRATGRTSAASRSDRDGPIAPCTLTL
jgi:hypothetical protein